MGNVRYLLDTHTFLWAALNEDKLGVYAKAVIENLEMPIYVSSVSAYEIMNKHRIGKLPDYDYVVHSYFEVLYELGAAELPLSVRHAHFAGKFKWDHRDPFDRLLAAQAFKEDMTLITNDAAFRDLPWLSTLW